MDSNARAAKRFGLGLIGIGRPWGYIAGEVPDEPAARDFLAFAFQSGVRYFDTAPSYGSSEERFGAFLASLTASERASITVATKFGEHWDDSRSEPFVDHSYDALARSLERSVHRLGRIDVLQLHKTTPEVLRSSGLARAWSFASSLGIDTIGLSVSDLDSARIGCADAAYQMLQLPLNHMDGRFLSVLPEIQSAGLWIAVNRPFAMGRSPGGAAAFRYLLDQPFSGVILSGTKSMRHLADNLQAFRLALDDQAPSA